MEAGYKLLDNWSSKYPPMPSDLKALIPRGEENTDGRNLDYVMIDHGSCEQCGKSNVRVIKEPKDTGVWQCRFCYTGLTGSQIAQKWKDLQRIIERST